MGAEAIAIEGQTPTMLARVRNAREGDFEAFEQLYREHVSRIHAICVRMTGDPSRAEELTQQAFVRAWQNLDGFRGDGSFFHWLRRLAINVVLGDRRSRDRREDREYELDESAVVFVVRPWAKTDDYWDVYWDVTREVKRRFDAEGITIPVPQRVVTVQSESTTR